MQQLQRIGIERVRRWRRGVDLEKFNPRHRDLTWRHRQAHEGELVVGYVGRLAHEKQVALLGSLAGIPGVKVVVAGDGPARRQLERQLPDAKVLGFQTGPELARTFASLDMFVHTGAHETFCQAAQEALASGVPVIAPAAGGLLDLVEPGRTGALFTPGSGDELARQVRALALDTDLRCAMSANARRSVEGRSWNVVGGQLVRHYREVLAA
jgi:phosphatidylinositol alpha 1,6-mannosyltransferase